MTEITSFKSINLHVISPTSVSNNKTIKLEVFLYSLLHNKSLCNNSLKNVIENYIINSKV